MLRGQLAATSPTHSSCERTLMVRCESKPSLVSSDGCEGQPRRPRRAHLDADAGVHDRRIDALLLGQLLGDLAGGLEVGEVALDPLDRRLAARRLLHLLLELGDGVLGLVGAAREDEDASVAGGQALGDLIADALRVSAARASPRTCEAPVTSATRPLKSGRLIVSVMSPIVSICVANE